MGSVKAQGGCCRLSTYVDAEAQYCFRPSHSKAGDGGCAWSPVVATAIRSIRGQEAYKRRPLTPEPLQHHATDVLGKGRVADRHRWMRSHRPSTSSLCLKGGSS